ncbi:DNA repair protein RecN [Marinilongibacter aquaticus]|uniref:DNA repair protein RecN n=1 Tax=Marinilongibacter aquaticus TaxID=2975157 RepID=UPI0021BDB846|nr:DNA repair protein RecN [Marinilongibacter aquaticus]UBM58868.1 DNA repair protein RecN [Marinilongibacter aquaticus]
MLVHLQIKNYALIERLEINPGSGLSIITGETGAGKSILLGALGLLMGKRADGKVLYNQEEKCVVEGTFDLSRIGMQELFEENDLDYEQNSIIRREISPSGKSRAFVNDTPVTLDVLKSLSDRLIDVHSQHDSILLGDSGYQLQLVDFYALSEKEKVVYREAFDRYREANRALRKVETEAGKLKDEFEFNSFLLEELESAKLSVHEQEEAEAKLSVLENAEEVKERLNAVLNLLNHPEQSLLSALQEGIVQLNPIAKLSQSYEDIRKRLQSVQIELNDIADEIGIQEEKVEYDPEQIQVLKDRLDLIFRLLQKHHASDVSELLDIQSTLSEKVKQVLNFDDELKRLQLDLKEKGERMQEKADLLSEKRKAVLPEIEHKVVQILKDLGIPNADFKVDMQSVEAGTSGTDSVEFTFSANKGFSLQNLRKVASGGEFSRLMFALKYILAEKVAMPTLIFDEVDTGISGEVAVKMGNLMLEMSENLQMMAITHLPQIAGKGQTHFFVYKTDTPERTISKMKKLSEEERILEIAKMIGGDKPSESALQSAKELLYLNDK